LSDIKLEFNNNRRRQRIKIKKLDGFLDDIFNPSSARVVANL
jgi:hypothetical protein